MAAHKVLSTAFAARLVFSARRNDHITPFLRDLHWLRVPERVKFRLCGLCVLVYRCLHGMAPLYLADDLQLTSTVGTRRQLRSADSPTLVVRSTRRSTRISRGSCTRLEQPPASC